jgi:hypothetical protein
MLPSFLGDSGAAVLVGAFDLHRSIAKDAVCRRDFPVCQSTLDQSGLTASL